MSDKLFKQLRDYDRTKPTENVEIGGILGLPVSSQTVEVPGRDGYVYVRIRNTNEIVQAQNERVSPIFNLPILMKWDRGGYSISGRDTKRYSNWGSSSSFLPKHGGQHSFYGGDPTFIYSRQFVPFATMPSGTNGSDAVYIEPHVYRNPQDGSWNYVGDQFSPNLLAAKPTDSQARMLLLYWDLNSDTVMVATGSAIVASATGTAQILAGLPLLMGQNDIPLAGIRLVSGTSAILWDNIYDVRQFATTTPPSFAGGFAVQDDGSPLGTGTTLNFVGNSVSASVSGSVMQIYVSGSAGGIGGVVGQENGVAIGTGTVINFAGDNIDVSISGSVVRVYVSGTATTQIQEGQHLQVGATSGAYPTTSYIGFGDADPTETWTRIKEVYDDAIGISTYGDNPSNVFIAGWNAGYNHIEGLLGDIDNQDHGNYLRVMESGTVLNHRLYLGATGSIAMGGGLLYAEDGALKFIGMSGTITLLAGS